MPTHRHLRYRGRRKARYRGGWVTLHRTGFAPVGRQTKFHDITASSLPFDQPCLVAPCTNAREQLKAELDDLRYATAMYDTVAIYETARARGATVVVPPARTATVSGHGPRSPARDRTIQLGKTLGRRRWKKVSGYHRQGRVENTFFRYTSIIGAGLRARRPAGQGSEVVLGCEILNRMTVLGRPVSYRIDR